MERRSTASRNLGAGLDWPQQWTHPAHAQNEEDEHCAPAAMPPNPLHPSPPTGASEGDPWLQLLPAPPDCTDFCAALLSYKKIPSEKTSLSPPRDPIPLTGARGSPVDSRRTPKRRRWSSRPRQRRGTPDPHVIDGCRMKIKEAEVNP
jgi:hypothetical protein